MPAPSRDATTEPANVTLPAHQDRLRELADGFELPAKSSMRHEELVDLLASSRRVPFEKLLGALKRAELKEIRRRHGLDDGGKVKEEIAARILGGGQTELALDNEDIQRAATTNDRTNFELVGAPAFDEALVDRHAKHGEFIDQLFSNEDILRFIRTKVLDEVYARLRRRRVDRRDGPDVPLLPWSARAAATPRASRGTARPDGTREARDDARVDARPGQPAVGHERLNSASHCIGQARDESLAWCGWPPGPLLPYRGHRSHDEPC